MRARRFFALSVVVLAVMAAPASAAQGAREGSRAARQEPPAPPGLVVPHLTLRVPADPWLGDTVPVTVAVDPALPGAPVSLEVLRADGWAEEATATLDTASRARLAWSPDTYGPVRLRASLPAGAGYAAVASGEHDVIVNRPNRHRVPYRYAHYLVNVLREYKLYYCEHGALVRTFVVALGRPGYRTPLGTFRIYGKRKPAGGALGSCAMFYRRRGGIAIHGTNQPHLLRRFPRPFSHGCSRLRNDEALWLYARVPKGTTVRNVR